MTAAADGLLVLSEMYSRGWTTTVDGDQAEIYPTDLALRGIPVSTGSHQVVLSYQAPRLREGLAISALAHLALIAAITGLIWTRRRDGRLLIARDSPSRRGR